MRRSAIYPKRYGQKVASLHQKFLEPRSQWFEGGFLNSFTRSSWSVAPSPQEESSKSLTLDSCVKSFAKDLGAITDPIFQADSFCGKGSWTWSA